MDSVAPLVSVVIVSKDRPALLARALDSVLTQDYPALEVILVDNQSEIPLTSPETTSAHKISVFKSPSHMNAAQSRSFALSKCTGSLITFLDDDDWFLPGKIRQQVDAFESNPELEIVYMNTSVLGPDGEEEETLRGTPYYPLMTMVHLNALMVRRHVIERVQFDERMSRNIDDHFMINIFNRFKWHHIDDIGAVWNREQRPDQITNDARTIWEKLRVRKQEHLNSTILCEDFGHLFSQHKDLRNHYFARHVRTSLVNFHFIEAFKYWQLQRDSK